MRITCSRLSDSLRKGFSELTEALSSQLNEVIKQSRTRKRSASESSDLSCSTDSEDTCRNTKRAGTCGSASIGDVDADIDGLLADNDDSGKPSDSSNIPTEKKDILGSIAKEYDLDECQDV